MYLKETRKKLLNLIIKIENQSSKELVIRTSECCLRPVKESDAPP